MNIKKCKREYVEVYLDQFTEHFKNMCADTQILSEDVNVYLTESNMANDVINRQFTTEEIRKLCKSLKTIKHVVTT